MLRGGYTKRLRYECSTAADFPRKTTSAGVVLD